MTKVLSIEGMSCEHCTKSVTNALDALAGVTETHVSLEKKEAIVHYDGDISEKDLQDAVEDIGFDIVAIH